jgi:WD40 repeat protein/serine/threonine protein kinase
MSEETLFHEALAKPAGERASFLDAACAGDLARRQRLAVLLRAHDNPGSFLGSPAVNPEATSAPLPGSAPEETVALTIVSGNMIGPYKLVQEIGEGGMGTVWMAQQTEPVKRLVALKLIKAGMDSRQVIARFEAERQALALMDHPHIARVLDGGTTRGEPGGVSPGRPYFVMDLVKGVPITRYCDEHHLTPRQRLELFIPVCQAIQHAHQKGIIHRDIKPSNVLIALYDGKAVPKVIDFGVAKAAGQALTDKTLVTGFGNLVGTLEYMSPEQAEINQLDIDTRSDIYSLGVLLYELLAGSPPFTRKELEKAGMLEMLRVIREQEPTKPSAKLSTAEGLPTLAANRGTEPAKLTTLVRGELDWIVMKALEKDRNRRYETANGFAADVQRYLADEPVNAGPPSARYRLKKFLRRHRGPVLAAALVFLVLLGGIVGTTAGLLEAEAAQQNERAERRDKETALVAQLTEEEAKNEANRKRIAALEDWRRTAYYNWLKLAHNEYRANNVARADEMLDSDTKCPADLRGFEWHYLKRLCHSELGRFPTAENDVGLLADWCRFSPDARWVVLGGAGTRTLRVYDTTTGKETCLLSIGFANFRDVTISHDGKRLAVCPHGGWPDETIHVWETATRRKCVILTRPREPFRLAHGFKGSAFSPDGRLLAATDPRGNLFIWDIQAAEERFQTWPAYFLGQRVGALAVAPGAPLGASVSMVAATATAKADAFALRFQIAAHPGDRPAADQTWLTKLAFSPDSKLVATASQGDQTVRIWNAETGKLVRDLGKGPNCTQVAFSPGGKWVAAGGGDNRPVAQDLSVWVWEVKSGKTECVIRGQSKPVNCFAFSPDELYLATGSQDGTLTVWVLGTGLERVTYRGHDRGVHALAFTPDGQQLLAVGEDRVVRMWDATRHPERRLLRCGGAWQATFSGAGHHVAGAAQTARFWGTVLWDADSGQELAQYGNEAEAAYAVALSPDGRRVAAAVDVDGTTGAVRIWDVPTGQLVHGRTQAHLLAQVLAAETVAPAAGPTQAGPLGSLLLRLGAREGMKWHNFSLIRSLPDQGLVGPYYAVAWSPDGTKIAAGGQDRMVRIWDAGTGKQLLQLGSHARTISAVVFSRDGRRLVSASGGITKQGVTPNPPIKLPLDLPEDIPDVKVWDVATGKELRSWSLPGKGPGLALSPDGETVAVSFGDTGLRLRLGFDLSGRATGMAFTDAANSPGVVRLYSVTTGAVSAELKGHTRPPWCVAFSPDGKRVVTGGGADETVKLWDASTGEEVLLVGRHPSVVTSVAFSSDGMKILSTSFREPIRVWDATPIPKK